MIRFLDLVPLVGMVVASASADGANAGAQTGGDYQKYMRQYGGGYQKYISRYAGDYSKYTQQGGGQQGGDYSKYMSQYAGDYSKYIQQGKGQQGASQRPQQLLTEIGMGDAVSGGVQQGTGQQGGDYQKYMSQYAGDYQKYMGGGQQGGSQQGGDYQKYMSQYAGDYQTYMGGGQQGGSQQGNSQQAGNFQKYMSQYAGDYQKYMKQGGGQQDTMDTASQLPQEFFAQSNADADAASHGDRKRHDATGEDAEADPKEKGHDDEEEHEAAGSDDKTSDEAKPKFGPAWANHFINQYAGNYMPQPKNSSDPKAWRDAFVKKYAGAYMHYVDAVDRLHERFPDAPATAAKCRTLKQLKEWRAAAREQLKTYIPKAYQVFSAGAVDQEYKDNKARIEKEIAEAKAKAKAAAAAAQANTSEAPDSDSKPDADADAQELSPVLFAATQAKGTGDIVSEYAGDYVPLPKNKSNTKEWRDSFVKHFAGSYAKYVDGGDRLVAKYEDAPAKASDCHTIDALRRWRFAQRAQVDTFVPHPYRTFGAGAVEQEYAENKARIEQEMAADKAKAGAAKTKASRSDPAAAKADDEEKEKKDDSANEAPRADMDDKDTPAASKPSVGAAATIGSSSFPLAGCLAIAAFAASMAFVVARPRASRHDALSEGLLAPQAPLAYVDVV